MKLLLLLLAVTFPSLALANAGGYLGGNKSNGALGAFHAENAGEIEMQTEDLRIDLHIESGHVEVEYTLHNPGKAITAEVGFPCVALQPKDSEVEAKPGETPPLRSFSAELDGKKLDFRVVAEPAAPVDFAQNSVVAGRVRSVPYWYTFKLPFKEGQSRTLRVRYDTRYYVSETSVSEDVVTAPETLTYLFSTAAVWKGPIHQGKVTINALGVPAEQVKLNLPKRFHRDGNVWTWTFQDFEPGLADDLIISARPSETRYWRSIADAGFSEKSPNAEFVRIGNEWHIEHRDFSVAATSTLPPADGFSYDANNLLRPSETACCWAEGAKGNGVGESLTLALRVPRRVSAIEVQNGFVSARNESLYARNGRVAELAVSINGGKPFTAALADEALARRYQVIPLPANAGEVKTIRLTIQKVYPGTKDEDTCLSGLRLITPLAREPKIMPAR